MTDFDAIELTQGGLRFCDNPVPATWTENKKGLVPGIGVLFFFTLHNQQRQGSFFLGLNRQDPQLPKLFKRKASTLRTS